MAKCKEEFCDQPTMGEGCGYKRCVDHSPPTHLREYIASLEDTRATAPTDAALRRVVEAVRRFVVWSDKEFPGRRAQTADMRAALHALDAADPAPAETGDDGEND